MTAWTPPPPGDRREQLPDHVLALIPARPYLSTACETAQDLETAAGVHRGQASELAVWWERMHARCRTNQKFTGQLCVCGCHQPDARGEPS